MIKFAFLFLLAFSSVASARPMILGPEDGLNQELQTTWNLLIPQFRDMITREVQKAIDKAIKEQDKDNDFKILKAYEPEVYFGPYPGLNKLSKQSLGISLPLHGTWGLNQKIKAQFKTDSPFGRIGDTSVYKIKIRKLKLRVNADFETKEKFLSIKQIQTPQVDLEVEVTCNHTIINGLLKVANKYVNQFAKVYIQEAINKEKHKLMEFVTNSKNIPGLGAPATLQDSGEYVDFETIALNIDKKIVKDNLPWGLLFESVMDVGSETSWEEAFSANGEGNPGVVVDYKGYGDSAIWTGHYLASQAFRYAVTKDHEAFQNILLTLEGIGMLLDVNGTGLLARAVFPKEHPIAQKIIADGDAYREKNINGQIWISYQHRRGISRDQYAGVFFGLATAYHFVKDPAVRSMAADRIEQMLDYLIANNWMITEDRTNVYEGGDAFPTFWTGINYQKLTYLVIGNHINPAKYGAALRASSELAESAWFPVWTSMMEPLDGYYGFNLNYISFFPYFLFETDPVRKSFMKDAFHLTNNHIGHHINAHFDMIKIAVEPETYKEEYAPSVREALRQFVRRNHRLITPKEIDFSKVEMEESPQYGKIPKHPLAIEQRDYTEFLWQRNPFAIRVYNNDKHETPGVDMTLPYWMGRYYEVF